MDTKGVLLCTRYSIAPNYYGYCGPDENSSLIDHLHAKVADREVQSILTEFDTLYLNLTLIAVENKIDDPFDHRVVEAYWVGNSLLKNIKNIDYVALLQEKFMLEKKMGKKEFQQIKSKFLSKECILPHHSFHVFNIFKRTGHDPSFHTLQTMDECRIGWGKIEKFQISDFKFQIILVRMQQLVIEKNRLKFGKLMLKELHVDYKGKTFLPKFKIGDWVSFHWGFVCDVLSERQVKSLEFYTQQSINFFNSTSSTYEVDKAAG